VKTLSKIVFDCGNDSLNELEKDQNIFMNFQNAATVLNCLDQFFHDFCVATRMYGALLGIKGRVLLERYSFVGVFLAQIFENAILFLSLNI